jgi:hypothetical protein
VGKEIGGGSKSLGEMVIQRGGSRIKIFGKSKGDIGPKSKAYEKPANKGFRDVFKLRFIDKGRQKF